MESVGKGGPPSSATDFSGVRGDVMRLGRHLRGLLGVSPDMSR